MGTTVKVVGGAIGGFIAYWLGGLDTILIALIAMLVIDYISGVLAAVHNNEVDSEVGWKGIVKKVFTLLVVAVAFIIEMATQNAFAIREVVIVFFIANEAISLVENAGKIGLPIPEKLTNILTQLKGKGDKNDEQN